MTLYLDRWTTEISLLSRRKCRLEIKPNLLDIESYICFKRT